MSRVFLLTKAALLANHRISVEKYFQVRIRKDLRSDIATFHHHTAVNSHLAQACHHPLTNLGVNRDSGSRLGDVPFSYPGRDVAFIEKDAISSQGRLQANAGVFG